MIAKIEHGQSIIGALSYNQSKIVKEKGKILSMHKMMETADGKYTIRQLYRSFEPYLAANRKTEKPVLHISLNPDPRDKVADGDFRELAKKYMHGMGYGSQPFVVFKHTDIERTHIHIVSVCIDEDGRKISDAFERRRSMDICRALEKEYKLTAAIERKHTPDNSLFRPVNYKAGNIKSQIASVVRHLPKYYQFQSYGGYNALLSLFNIAAEEVKGELQGKPKIGLVYFALDEKGEKASNPFKASLFGKSASFTHLQKHYQHSKENLKASPVKGLLKNSVETAMHSSPNEAEFKQQLAGQSINAVVRRNGENLIYGITFIDHDSKTVWNGSQIDKGLAAGVFQKCWNSDNDQQFVANDKAIKNMVIDNPSEQINPPHHLFSFLEKEHILAEAAENIAETLGSLIPESLPEDYDEIEFANRMKRKSKRRKK